MITDNRVSSLGGGVVLFLKEDVDYCLREDLGIENIWVGIAQSRDTTR